MTPEKGIPYQRHKPSAALRAFLDPLDPGAYFDCGRARLRGLDDALLREARSRGRTIGDDSFQLVATDMGLVYCRPSISFAIAARWNQISVGEPHGEDPVVLTIGWPTHGELHFTVSRRLAGNIYRRWTQLRPNLTGDERTQPKPHIDQSFTVESTTVESTTIEPKTPGWPDYVESVSPPGDLESQDPSDWEIVDRIGSPRTMPWVVQGNEVAKPDRRQTAKALRRERQKKAASRTARRKPGNQTAETWNPASHPSDLVPVRHEYAPQDPDAIPGDGPLLRAAAHAAAVAAKLELEEAADAEQPQVREETETKAEGEGDQAVESSAEAAINLLPEVDATLEAEVTIEPQPIAESQPADDAQPAEDVELPLELESLPASEQTVDADFRSEEQDVSEPEVLTQSEEPVTVEEPQPDLPPGFRYVVPPAVPGQAAAPAPVAEPEPEPSVAAAFGVAAQVHQDEEGVPAITGDHPAAEPRQGIGRTEELAPVPRPARTRTRTAAGEPSWVGSPASLVGAAVTVSSLVLITTLAVASYRRTSEVAADVNPAGPAVSIIDHQRFRPSARGGPDTGFDPGLGAGFGAGSDDGPTGEGAIDSTPVAESPTPTAAEPAVDPTATTGSGTAPVSSIPSWSEQDGPRTCNSNYSGCVPDVGDVDCPDDGDGPIYWPESAVVMGEDVYELDTDGDGEICEPDQPRLDQLGSTAEG